MKSKLKTYGLRLYGFMFVACWALSDFAAHCGKVGELAVAYRKKWHEMTLREKALYAEYFRLHR